LTDLVPLGLVFETKGAEAFEKTLDGIPVKSGKAERATDSLGAAANKMSGSLLAAVQAIQKQVGELVELARLQQAATGGANNLAAANDRVAAATMRFSSSFTPLQAGAGGAATATRALGAAADATAQDLREVAGAAQIADAHVKAFQAQAMVMPKIHNAATVSTKAMTQATLNLSRQFADIGVTAAMGMNPLMILIQQGPQIADAFAMAKTQGIGFNAILANIGKTVAPLMAVLGPLAVIGAAIGAAFAIGAQQINASAGDITRGLNLTDDQMKRLKKSGEDLKVTFGDTFKATFQVAGEYLAKAFEGPIGAIRKAFNEWYDDLIANTVKEIKGIVGAFIGAFEAIKAVWKMLPAAIADGMVSAVNFVLNATEKMVNGTIALINKVTPAINAFARLTNNPLQIGQIAKVSIPEFSNPNAGAMRDAGTAAAAAFAAGFAKGGAIVDKVFGDIAARAIKNAKDRILKAAGDAKKAPKGPADPRDTSAERDAQIDQMMEQARRDELQAQLTLTKGIAERALLEKKILAADEAIKEAQLARVAASIADDKGLSTAKKTELLLQLEKVAEIQKSVGNLKARAIDEAAVEALEKQALAIKEGEVAAQTALLQSQLGLNITNAKRRDIELRILKLQQQIERAKLVEAAKSKDPAVSEPAKKMLEVFDEIAKNQQKAADGLERRFEDAARAVGDVADAFRRRDWNALWNSIKNAFDELAAAFKKGASMESKIGAIAGVASGIGNAIGGKAGKALSGAASGAMAGAQIGMMIPGVGPLVGAIGGAIIGGITSLLKKKPSNHGALASLTDSTFSLAGDKRTDETSEAATQASRAILQGQKLLQDAGLKLTATVKSIDIGTRDATDIMLSNGKALTSAVGDAAAAAETGLKAVLDGASYVNDAQKRLVTDMLGAGAGFDEIASALSDWSAKMAASKNLGQDIADQILKFTDPQAYDVTTLQRAQIERAKELKAYLDEGFISSEDFTKLSDQLATLNDLELVDTLKKYNQAAQDAAQAAADAAMKTVGKWLDIANDLQTYSKSLSMQSAAASSPLAAFGQARGAFNALSPSVRSGDAEAILKIQDIGNAYIAAARDVAPDTRTLAAVIGQVQQLTMDAEQFARSQSGDAYQQLIGVGQGTNDQIAALRAENAARAAADAEKDATITDLTRRMVAATEKLEYFARKEDLLTEEAA